VIKIEKTMDSSFVTVFTFQEDRFTVVSLCNVRTKKRTTAKYYLKVKSTVKG